MNAIEELQLRITQLTSIDTFCAVNGFSQVYREAAYYNGKYRFGIVDVQQPQWAAEIGVHVDACLSINTDLIIVVTAHADERLLRAVNAHNASV